MERRDEKNGHVVTIEYRTLGTVALDQLAQALWEDIQALKDIYNVKYVTGVRFTIPVTNEYGDPLALKHPDGGPMRRLDTHYYRPACLDYQL